jgi:hypothetical protein
MTVSRTGTQTPRGALTRVAILAGMFCAPFVTAGAEAQQPPSFRQRLATRIGTFDSNHQSLVATLLRIIYEHHLPLGLEYVDRDAARRPLDVHLRDTSVQETIQSLVDQLPEYRVTFGPGVVEVYSPKARADPSNLLNTVIESFQATNQTTRMASAALHEALAATLHPVSPPFGNILDSPSAPKLSLYLRGKKVYEILDAIAAKDGSIMWAVAVPANKLSALQPELWRLYELGFPNWEVLAREDLLRLFPPP